MTTKNLSVQIEAVVRGLQSVQALGKHLKEVSAASGGTNTNLNSVVNGVKNLSDGATSAGSALADFLTRADQVNKSFLSMAGYVKGAVAAFVAFAGVSAGKDSADLAAKNETLGNTLEVIGFNAGYSSEQLKAYEQEVKKIGVTTGVARDTLTQFIRAGIEIGPAMEGGISRVAELTRAAQNLARATGQNTSETLQRLVLNIQQLDTVGLRYIGVTVNSEQAFASYAQTLGKAASALSTAERQQALMNEVVKQGAGIAGVYEKSLETVGGQVQSMKRYQEEAAAQIGRVFLPAYSEVVKASTAFLKQVQSIATAIADSGVAAETFRSITKTALDLGSAIAGSVAQAIKDLTPSVLALVRSFQQAFGTFDFTAVTQGSQQLLAALTRVASAITSVFAGSSMEFRAVAESVLILVSTIGRLVSTFADMLTGQQNVAAGTSVLRAALTGLGYFIAGLSDGITVFGMLFQQAIGLAATVVGTLTTRIGQLVSFAFPSMGKSIQEVGEEMTKFGLKAVNSANKTMESFANGDTALNRYQAAVANITVEYEKLESVSGKGQDERNQAFERASEIVRQYAEEVRKGSLTSEQATAKYAATKQEVQQLADKFQFSDAQVKQLNSSLDQSKTKGEDVSKAFADLKLSATELSTGLSDAGGQSLKAFETIATQAKITGDQISKAFSTALNSETSIAGLTRFKDSIDKLFASGKVSAEEYRDSVAKVGIQFNELVEKGLAAAKTSGDFATLSKAIKEVGASGAVSGGLVSSALEKIAEKARGARSEAKQLAAEFKGSTAGAAAIADADLKSSKAALDVGKARLEVEKAKTKVQQQNTAENKAALEVAKAELALAEQKATQASLEANQERADQAVLSAQRELDRAKEEAARKPADAAAQALVDKATRELEVREIAADEAAGMVNIQKQQVAQSERQVALAQAGLDKAKQQRDVEEAKAAAHQAFLGGLIASYNVINNASRTLQDAGFAARTEKEMGDQVRRMAYENTGSIEEMVRQLARGERLLARMVAQANAQKEQANKMAEAFNAAKEKAAGMEAAVTGTGTSMKKVVSMGEVYEAQMRSVRQEAESISRSAAEAALSFVRGLGSIKEELLQAQGKEEEAAKLRFEQRRNDLRLEYDLLRVKLLGAKLTAEAAGVDTANITKAMRELDSGFSEAMSNLDKLEDIDSRKRSQERAKKEQEEAEKAAQAAAESAKAQAEAAAEAKTKFDAQQAEAQKALVAKPSEPVQSTAILNGISDALAPAQVKPLQDQATSQVQSISQPQVSKVIRVELASGGGSVSATIDEQDESTLLNILQQARSTA